jgi:hypothetical protein
LEEDVMRRFDVTVRVTVTALLALVTAHAQAGPINFNDSKVIFTPPTSPKATVRILTNEKLKKLDDAGFEVDDLEYRLLKPKLTAPKFVFATFKANRDFEIPDPIDVKVKIDGNTKIVDTGGEAGIMIDGFVTRRNSDVREGGATFRFPPEDGKNLAPNWAVLGDKFKLGMGKYTLRETVTVSWSAKTKDDTLKVSSLYRTTIAEVPVIAPEPPALILALLGGLALLCGCSLSKSSARCDSGQLLPGDESPTDLSPISGDRQR